jgi:hypothetical protein
MTRLQKALLLLAMIAGPAAAHTYFSDDAGACFTSGSATFRVAAGGSSDYKVRFIDGQARPDLRMQLVDDAAEADFVLVDDVGMPTGNACKGPGPVKTIAIDPSAAEPDVTVSLSPDAAAADYRIFVQSARFSHQDAAALLAIMTKVQARYRLVGHAR